MNFWNDPLKVAADWLEGLLTSWGMNAVFAHVLVAFLGILLLLSILMVLDIFLVWLERKVVSRFQDRIGPNRAGVFGFWSLVLFLAVVEIVNVSSPPPPNVQAVAWVTQSLWLLVLWGYWVDRHRAIRSL